MFLRNLKYDPEEDGTGSTPKGESEPKPETEPEAEPEAKTKDIVYGGQVYSLTEAEQQALIQRGIQDYMKEQNSEPEPTAKPEPTAEELEKELTAEERLEKLEKQLKEEHEARENEKKYSQVGQLLTQLVATDDLTKRYEKAQPLAIELTNSLVNRKVTDNHGAAFNESVKALEAFEKEVIAKYLKRKEEDSDLSLGEGIGGSSAGKREAKPLSGIELLAGKGRQRLNSRISLASRG